MQVALGREKYWEKSWKWDFDVKSPWKHDVLKVKQVLPLCDPPPPVSRAGPGQERWIQADPTGMMGTGVEGAWMGRGGRSAGLHRL